ncbi:hypothetical protein A5745_13400 [Mycobacterium sp. IS-2888]|uniref:hypothetical protein n=1 Tax=Mycobacterium sp. IS-1264 TaxID=1834158 RepID=UPI00096D7CC4|nr:hypothetical protein [Mycobacterium sp. IS-1264]OMC45988.1 hypothetical protein A5745_13400 [Mycobacterium sp. IS-2888]
MKFRACTAGLFAGGVCVANFFGATGLANADPQTDGSGGANIVINQLISGAVPALRAPTQDEGDSERNWGGVGMYCENPFVRCH